MGTCGQAEIELKFPLPGPETTREKLLQLGFVSHGRLFEHNLVLDTPEGALAADGRLLRLRRDDSIRLTFKEPHEEAALHGRFKAKRESELEVADFETLRHIFQRLGFTKERIYEKYREHFTRADRVCAELDCLPHLGYFLELEAPPEKIEEVAAALGLDPASGKRENYFRLFTDYCAARGLELQDMRFADERPA
ncbi:MAG: hypothetical protein A3F83_08495 [Candidatus Glassbacteria bacterium RIFCSPLOWO2_12_FULL_58_11]|uniref:CYTH domain-containing protein n=1 Tax=Candidatus Glassbacteria bacterium RIFCSPLOWO2_12_FULL_58_11 TaxID=1817867 RepID=A0A1F5YYL9_9BACT|nr:MAG: hypothetical protein A3F83_08495 [Candidatus Glassbacteria bacterium RIFCSPLOWO2_12_FULL_58_11]